MLLWGAYCLLLTTFSIELSAARPGDTAGSQALDNLQAFEYMLPHQKAYLHIDKDRYLAGEQIWFQAYIVTQTKHLPDKSNTNLHVELINLDGDFVTRSLLPVENGLAFGDLQLPDSIHEGSYMLRAYTDLMRNFDHDFFFEKEVTIRNHEEENYISRSERRKNRRFNNKFEEKRSTYQLGLFPESGHIVAGTENRVAFKMADQLGKGVEGEGILQDQDGNEVLSFSSIHDGMGYFVFTPGHGNTYETVVTIDGNRHTQPLPPIKSQGYVMRVDRHGQELAVRVNASLITTALPGDISILAHTRGRVQFFQEAYMDEARFETSIPVGELPDGITHITLFDNNGPLAERLVFINENGVRPVEVDFDGSALHLTAAAQPGVNGSLSLAVLEAFGEQSVNDRNIATYLLLKSDLQGSIHNASYYLTDHPEAKAAADLLMMTHGWRRFSWDEILARDFPEIRYEEAEGLVVEGKVESLSDRHSFRGVKVKLTTSMDGRTIYSTETDRNGYFRFEGLEYHDLFKGSISVETTAPRRAYEVNLIVTEPDDVAYAKSIHTAPKRSLERGDEWSRVARPDYFHKFESARRVRGEGGYYGAPDQVIHMDELSGHYYSMQHVLNRNVRGLTFRDGVMYLRGPISFESSSQPAFIIDGSNVDQGAFLSLRPNEVSRIEVLNTASAAILGVRGAAGALIAYTNRTAGTAMDREFTFRGYRAPSAFYESQIQSSAYEQYGIPKTRYWETDITLDEHGKAQIKLPDHFEPDNVSFHIEGIDEAGNLYLQKSQ